MNIEKLEELEKDSGFMTALKSVESPESMKALLASYGIDISDEELKEAYSKAGDSDKGELSESEMEKVSGGIIITGPFLVWLIIRNIMQNKK